MYMGDIKIFAEHEKKKKLEIIIQKMKICSHDIRIDIRIRHLKCVMLIMKSQKREITEGIELPNQERIRTLRENEN